MINHISSLARACYFHHRRIRQVRRCLNEHRFEVLVQALVLSRIDYCNYVQAGLPKTVLLPLTSVLHVSSKIFNHATTSRPDLSNSTGFQSMPEFTSRSVSSCTIYIPTLQHTVCPPWSHPASPSCQQSLRSASKGDFICVRSCLKFKKVKVKALFIYIVDRKASAYS